PQCLLHRLQQYLGATVRLGSQKKKLNSQLATQLVALHLTACHYPKLCSLGAIRTPSTKACKVFIPCQSVCHPGKPSLVRLRCPPKRPMARATSRTVPSVRPDFWRKTSSSRGLKPAWAASASGCLRRRSRSSIRRRATTRMLATAANSLSALANGSLSAPSPGLLALCYSSITQRAEDCREHSRACAKSTTAASPNRIHSSLSSASGAATSQTRTAVHWIGAFLLRP